MRLQAKKAVGYWLSPEIAEKVRKIAEIERIPMSSVVEQLIARQWEEEREKYEGHQSHD